MTEQQRQMIIVIIKILNGVEKAVRGAIRVLQDLVKKEGE